MAGALIECGFCCNSITLMEDPVELPCSHVHCLGCIKGFFKDKKVARCPERNCGKVIEAPFDSLPPYATNLDMCDTCLEKRRVNKPAVCYCSDYKNYYCQTHQQVHEDLTVGHKMRILDEDDSDDSCLNKDYCSDHRDQLLSLGCLTCLLPFCVKCRAPCEEEKTGGAHKLISLEDLVKILLNKDLTKDVTEREEQFERLFKKTCEAVTKYDEETEEGLQAVGKARHEHLEAVRDAYDQLEHEWTEKRVRQKEEMTDFRDNEVLMKWNYIRQEKEALESKIKQGHQAETLKGFKQLMAAKRKGLTKELPKLVSEGSVKFKVKGQSREIELELVPADDVIIVSDDYPTQPPTQLIHDKTIKLPANPYSLHTQDGCLYVGMSNSKIARIDKSYNVDESFISCPEPVVCLVVHNDRVYTLIGSTPATVCVYDLSGERLANQKVSCNSRYLCNLLAIVSDELVVAEQPLERLSIFSLSLKWSRNISCSFLGSSDASICALNDMSIIISNPRNSQVTKFNLATGKAEWSLQVFRPGSVCCYGSKYVLVGRFHSLMGRVAMLSGFIWSGELRVIDTVSGSLLPSIRCNQLDDVSGFGMQVIGSILAIISNRWGSKVPFYKLSAQRG